MLLSSVVIKLAKWVEMPFQILQWQIKQNECQSLKDNLLLWKLRNRAPRYFDRDLEYPWVIENVSIQSGKLLDIGSTIGEMLYDLLPKGLDINTLNINKQPDIKNVTQIEGDIRATDLKSNLYDVITCISTLEHIGVQGRYGVQNDEYGDIKAMKEMLRLLKPGGKLLLTVPYGAKDVLPINKLYNKARTDTLFEGYKVIRKEYRKYNNKHHIWLSVTEDEASQTEWLKSRWYSLGLFVLEKPSK